MARMKESLLERLDELAAMSGYDPEELAEHFWTYVRECIEDGESVDLDYFEDITMEHDW